MRSSQIRQTVAVALPMLCVILWAPPTAHAVHFGEKLAADVHPAVGMVVVKQSDGSISYGTGTLLAPDMVLTAAHVVEAAATPYHVRFISDAFPDVAVPALSYRIHPGYYGSKPLDDWPSASLQANDIALVRLASSYPEKIPPFRASAERPRRGQVVTVIGYGRDETGAGEVRRSGKLQFLRERNGFFVFSASTERFQRVDHGDSGGPLFIEKEDGSRQVIAIVQGGDTLLSAERGLGADEYAFFVGLNAHTDWFTRRWEELQEITVPQGEDLYFLIRETPATPQPAVSFSTMATLFDANLPAERARSIIFTRGMCDPLPATVVKQWVESWLPEKKIYHVSMKPKSDEQTPQE